VVVYVMDALRSSALERLPDVRSTENWKTLRKAGFEFKNHHSVAPNTLPATKALFTGRIWKEHGGRPLPSSAGPTIAEDFENAGFLTALFSNNPYVSGEFGVGRGFQTVDGQEVYYEDENTDSEDIVGRARQWLESNAEDGQTVFLYLHVLNPHNPYSPPSRFKAWIPIEDRSTAIGTTRRLLALANGRELATSNTGEQLHDLYVASTLQALSSLELLRKALLQYFSPEDVLLVVTSDHGEELGDHGSFLHGYTLFEEMLHIPALVHWPGRISPGQTDALTTTLDLECFLRSLVVPAALPCRMNSILRGEALEPTLAYAAAASVRGGIYSVRSDRYKLILAPQQGRRWGMGTGRGRRWDSEYLFDLRSDPREIVNLLSLSAMEPQEKAQYEMLMIALRVWISSREPHPYDSAREEAVSEAASKRLKALGYIVN